MAKTIIHYDKDLPEIPGRRPWEKPAQHLVKDNESPTGWRVAEGRRPSSLLLVPKLREEVDHWRENGYPGASDVTKRLFEYWFDEDHEVPGFTTPFRYWFAQREAIETLVWLVEIDGITDTKKLIERHVQPHYKDLFERDIDFQTTMDGRRQLRRWIPEKNAEAVQDLPPENLRRYAFKLATGTGKTWVMAMTVVWSYFHKKKIPGSPLSTNFLILTPNVIVYQRLARDFAANRIFYELPLIPPEWRSQFTLKPILRGEANEPDPSGNLFLTNIQQLYESREEEWTPKNAADRLLGKPPKKDDSAIFRQRSMLERIKSSRHLVVINDEAHHVHDQDLAWSQTLLSIHNIIPGGLSLWLDFSATPKDQNGTYFPWTVVDYPLAQAVEDRIVKIPLIVTKEDEKTQPPEDPDNVSKNNITEKYAYWIHAAVHRWQEHFKIYKALGIHPVLFVTVEKNVYADAIGEFLLETKEFGFQKSDILVIHTDSNGEITQKDLEKARRAAQEIDRAQNPIKVIISVLMLREGWDVRNVTVVLGLRPFTSKAEILPEQVIGRGLRLMNQVGPDRLQTLEVFGNPNLLKVLRTQLEAEGVGIADVRTEPPDPVIIAPVQERIQYDIVIPITRPRFTRNIRNLKSLDIRDFDPIYDQEKIDEDFRLKLKMEFVPTGTEVHKTEIALEGDQDPSILLSRITRRIQSQARLPDNYFRELYPHVKKYVATRCFGRIINLEDKRVIAYLARSEVQDVIAKYLAHKIGETTLQEQPLEFQRDDFRLSERKPFPWRRNLPPLVATKTIFNYVATYNDFERRFAEFLDRAPDVLRFASLATTEQGESDCPFRIDYLKPNGAIGFYYPDWVVVQETSNGEINWIIETKGREWEDTEVKDKAMGLWCSKVSQITNSTWRYHRVNQSVFERKRPNMLKDLLEEKPQLL